MNTEARLNVCLFIWTILAINIYEFTHSNGDIRF